MSESTTVLNRLSTLHPAEADGADDSQPTTVELVASMGDVGALRGVTDATADLAECTCPGPCERDHANE